MTVALDKLTVSAHKLLTEVYRRYQKTSIPIEARTPKHFNKNETENEPHPLIIITCSKYHHITRETRQPQK